MAEAQTQCRFKLRRDLHYQCRYPAIGEGRCIFHIPKVTEEEKENIGGSERMSVNRIEEEFYQKFSELLERNERDPACESHDFRGFRFPPIFLQDEFTKRVDFREAIFQYANFHHCLFNQEANFREAAFNGVAWFVNAAFLSKADFGGVVFSNMANFSAATFTQDAYFSKAVFNQKADFMATSFNGGAILSSITFSQEADFWQASFAKGAIFSESSFAGDAFFCGDDDNGCFLDTCYFQRIKVHKDAIIIFEKVNFEKATFLDTNLEQITLRDVRWHRPKSSSKRRALWDEVRPLEQREVERDYEKIAENYRQLVLNYERKRDYGTAEDFHIGEMEMLRKRKGAKIKSRWWRKMREWANTHALYKMLSNYGTSYWQAFMVLLLMLFIFSGIFLCTGFQLSKGSTGSTAGVIEYNLWPDSEHHVVPFSQWISDYCKAILFSLSIITFQRERFYEPAGDLSRFWLFIAVFVLTSQTALVLLAIRRRFKR
jgi:uncharacterized protein YjbI with pentapeptide repeats